MDITGDTPREYTSAKNKGYNNGNMAIFPQEIAENNEKIKSIFERISNFLDYDLEFKHEPIWNKNELADGASLKEVKLTMNNPYIHDFKGESYRD